MIFKISRNSADTVSANFPLLPSYSHSLLYLVSRAYEEQPETTLAGMQRYVGQMPKAAKLDIAYSGMAVRPLPPRMEVSTMMRLR